MKTIGLIGGMSWESTVPYYRRINELVNERLGGLHSARIVLSSVGQGAEGIVLGCTEIPLLVAPSDSPVPLFDTGELHVRAAVDRALGER